MSITTLAHILASGGAADGGISPSITLAGIIGLGVVAQWIAWRLRIPSVLMLLLAGLGAGPIERLISGHALLDPDVTFGQDVLFPAVSLSVAIILFEGGMSLRFAELRQTTRDVRNLVTIGAAVTWVLTTTAAFLLLGLPIGVSALLGAILVVSGPTVVVPMLRHIRPTRRVGSVVKWEGIVNDPIGAVLAVLVFEVLRPHGADGAFGVVAWSLGAALLAGGVIGWFLGWLLVLLIRKHWIPDYLHAPTAVGLVLVGFAVSNQIQAESGLITVTLAGILVANQKRASVKHILEFNEIMRTLLISVLFIVLSARLPLEKVGDVLNPGSILFLVLLIFIIRPAAVFASTRKSELKRNEKLFVAWMAPRGIVAAAVTSIFALELQKNGVIAEATADQLVLYTFLVVVSTVAVYGLTASHLARRLKLASHNPQGLVIAGADRWQLAIGKALKTEGYDVLVVDTNWQNISQARMAGLQTFYGSVLSEYAMDRMELDGKGRLLAMTLNDELNALAVQHFIETFGRVNCYQLAMGHEASERQEKMGLHMHGRLLFDAEATFDSLQQRVLRGSVVRTTLLTEEFEFTDFLEQYADKALPLGLIKENGDFVLWTANSPPSPKPGQKLLALIEEGDQTRMMKVMSRRAKKVEGD